MFSRNPQLHYLGPVALTSLLLLALCAFTALFLLREQDATSATLNENLASRREADDLQESLIGLIGLLRDRGEKVNAIHERIAEHLEAIRGYADKPDERILADLLQASYNRYLELWHRIHRPGADRERGLREAAVLLESETLKKCQELVAYNSDQIFRSEQDHRLSIQRLAWGMAAVGVTGAIAGLVLGYGVARALSRSIQRVQFGLQDAAGKLGHAVTEIVLTGEGDIAGLEEQVQELLGRIEQVVSKLNQREREVLRAEQLAAVGQLAAGVAHEIRNPLTSIKMLVQAGQEDPAGLSREDLEIVVREILRMERSLQVFLDFARLPKPERSPEDLGELTRHTLDLVRGRAVKQGVELRLIVPKSRVEVAADSEQIQQVLVNLSLNALDVMPSGGTLEMVVVASAAGGEVAVRDTGPGVAPEMMSRVFEPFVSSKETGIGLGLVISRRIVEEHGGQLTVANRVEGGACFTVVLPKSKAEETEPASGLPRHHAEPFGHR